MDTVKICLRDKWKFFYGDMGEAWFKGFDDSAWDDVMIPHDWSVEAPFSRDYSSGTGYLRGGIGWYRCHFCLPKEYEGQNVRLSFDGVYKNSSVWFNSYFIGKRPSGYASFSMDISEYVRFGEDNVISVKVCHEDIADSRWFTGSGIVKDVTITISEKVSPIEYGVFLSTDALTIDSGKTSARISIKNIIANRTQNDKKVRARCVLEYCGAYELTDRQGGGDLFPLFEHKKREVAEDYEEATIELFGETIISANNSSELKINGIVEKPHLWSSSIPNLYKLSTYYSVDGGENYLVDEQKIGIRLISFDPDKGFYCNGESEKICGVCVHDDGGVLGSAMKQEVWQRRLELLKEAGCNAIRCSHNPHMPQLYDLCDELGFYVMDEAFDEWENSKNKWTHGHNVYPPCHQGYYEDFPKWHKDDLINMIDRDRRHPSIILWSIGNEIDYPNDPYVSPIFKEFTGNNDNGKPAAEMLYNPDKPDMSRLSYIAKELSDIVKKEDGTRPVTLAAAFPELSSKIGFIDNLDVVGYNYKEHLYEESHAKFPDKTFLGSENGHGLKEWKIAAMYDYICGQFLWTGIDYLGEAHGWPIHGSHAGILNTAGLPKAEYYRRKSFWTSKPFIRMFTERPDEEKSEWLYRIRSWNYEKGQKVIVKCYVPLALKAKDDRVKDVKLYINDHFAKSSSNRAEDGSFRFEVEFEEGKIEARLSLDDGTNISDELFTSGASDHFDVFVYDHADLIRGDGFKKSSSEKGYIYQIVITLKDKSSNDVTSKDEEISVEVSDNAQIMGLDGGDLADNTDMRSSKRKTYRGQSVIYVRRNGEGEIKLSIKSDIARKKVIL